jgi:hypothetical protein
MQLESITTSVYELNEDEAAKLAKEIRSSGIAVEGDFVNKLLWTLKR